MKVFFNSKFLEHNKNGQEEGIYRIKAFEDKFPDEYTDGEKYLSLVHPPEYIEKIRNSCMNRETMAEVVLSPETYEAARLAVGLTVKASREGGFAVVRPPGHHAGKSSSMGFCLFNNIAIAVQKLVNKGNKVLIFDFDAHHGNGTQDIFYASNRVFYISIHQSFSWPHTGNANESGIGPGKGYTMNIPLMLGSGDKAFLKAINKAIAAGHKFEPDIVAVSAGFDGYYKDKMMNLDYSLKAFYECGFRLGRAFNNIFAVLEGGYHEDVFQCVMNFIDGIEVGSRPVRDRFNHEMSIG